MSKTWGNIGAWAADAELAEAEEREAAAAAAASSTTDTQSFPSLKEAATTKPKKKKMTLSEFTMGGYGAGAPTGDSYSRLTPDEMLRLPTGPKERSADEMQHGRLGGGFSSYGRPARPMRDRDESWGGGNRRSYGGFDDEQQPSRRGPPSRAPDMDLPSRADEVDNWATNKKPFQPAQSQDYGRGNRYGGLGSGGGGVSRADEVDNWAATKKPIPTRSSTFGSGFRNSGPEPDRWTRGGGGAGFRDERSRLQLDPPKLNEPVIVKTDKPNPFGAARPREQVLAEKGLDWKKLEQDLDSKKPTTSRPTSSHSSRPSSAQSSRSESQGLQGSETVGKPSRPKVNPFGDAKPRELLLEERGQDWRKIDQELEHRRIDRYQVLFFDTLFSIWSFSGLNCSILFCG